MWGSTDHILGGGLFWQKLTAVRELLDRTLTTTGCRQCDWVMWLDADVVITRPSQSLENLVELALRTSAKSDWDKVHVVLSDDPLVWINSGVFFVRNTEQGRSFIDAVTALYPLYKDLELPEQSAMEVLAFLGHGGGDSDKNNRAPHPNIIVVPQRQFNSFVADPNSKKRYKESAEWKWGDFAAHFTAIDSRRRDVLMPSFLDNMQDQNAR